MLEYRGDFLMWSAFALVYHTTAIATIFLIFHRFPHLHGWRVGDIAVLYAIGMLARAINSTFFNGVIYIPFLLQMGRFDIFLVRPQSVLFQILTMPSATWPSELLFSIIYLVIASSYAGLRLSAIYLIQIAVIALGGALIELAATLSISSLSFWFVRVDSLRRLVTQSEQLLTRYPITIYSPTLQFLLTWVFPVALFTYFPAVHFLHKDGSGLPLSRFIVIITPLVGLLCIAFANGFLKLALRHYQGTGT